MKKARYAYMIRQKTEKKGGRRVRLEVANYIYATTLHLVAGSLETPTPPKSPSISS